MYSLMKTLAWGLGLLTPRLTGALAKLIAFVIFDAIRLRRDLMLRNLGLAFPTMPEAQMRRVARASVENFALTAFEFLRSKRVDIAGHIELDGVEHIRTALDRGQGAYILCFHLGNWEAMGAKCTRVLTPSHVLVKKVGRGGVERFVSELRTQNGFYGVKREKKGDGYNAIRDILARGEIVGFVMDQARPGEPRLPFFGVPAKTNTSFAAIWRKIPAPIIPAFIERTGVGRHTLHFFPEVKPTVTQDPEADVLRHSTEFNAVVETHVRKHPDQYFWMHNRWK